MTPSAKALAIAVALGAVLASPVAAASEPKTRLVSCDAGNCLIVTGRRADASSTVTINGHAVAVQGARHWRVSLPVDTVRSWSAPYARTLTVSIIGAGTSEGASAEADLPIGLLGHRADLAMLVVRPK